MWLFRERGAISNQKGLSALISGEFVEEELLFRFIELRKNEIKIYNQLHNQKIKL